MPTCRSTSLALAAALMLLSWPDKTMGAAYVTQQSAGNGDLNVTVDPGSTLTAYGTIHPGSTQESFRLCWKKSSQVAGMCNVHHVGWPANTQIGIRQLGGFTSGVTYKMGGWCYCSQDAQHPNWEWWWLEDIKFTYGPPPPPPPTLVSKERVRIRNVLTSQCSYVEANGFAAKHWVCWPDPKMIFHAERYSDGFWMFRDQESGRCLWGGLPNMPAIGSGTCGTLGTRFQVLPVTGNQVQLYVPVTGLWPVPKGPGGCLFVEGGNGGPMRKGVCGSHERFRFVLDPA